MPAGHGLNPLSGEFVDLFEDGVIDPLRVTRLTIQHAASVAALMLTIEALVAEELFAQLGAIIAPGFRGSRRRAGAAVVAGLGRRASGRHRRNTRTDENSHA